MLLLQYLIKIWEYRWILRSFHKTLYFNFHYLKFKDAIRLPILLYKPRFISLKGSIAIRGDIKFGMIQMGCHRVFIYPNSGISWENRGGKVEFCGRAYFGNDTYISIGHNANVKFGKAIEATAGFKFVSVKNVTINNHTSFGWGCLLTDTNFHPLINKTTGEIYPASYPIEIGEYNWFASKCNILPGVITPSHAIFSIGTTIIRNAQMESFCIMKEMGGVMVAKRNIYRDIHGEHDYEHFEYRK